MYIDQCERKYVEINGSSVEVIAFNTPEAYKKYVKTGEIHLKEIIIQPKLQCIHHVEKKKDMANPALIYAFDNLGPYRFTELCGQILSQHFNGFYLGGVGRDGGVDAEVNNVFDIDTPDNINGIWSPEKISPIFDIILQKGDVAIFQFKHIVVGRCGGQTKARSKLLNLYKSTKKRKSELLKNLVIKKKPYAYVLVTNAEINSIFRDTFIKQCQRENNNIKEFKIIGLDELDTLISVNTNLRHLYFPTIYGFPRYNLKIKFSLIPSFNKLVKAESCCVSILNVGELTSYVNSILLKMSDGYSYHIEFMSVMKGINNPDFGAPLLPGQSHSFYYPYDSINDCIKKHKGINEEAFPYEIVLRDQIDNVYTERIWQWFDLIS